MNIEVSLDGEVVDVLNNHVLDPANPDDLLTRINEGSRLVVAYDPLFEKGLPSPVTNAVLDNPTSGTSSVFVTRCALVGSCRSSLLVGGSRSTSVLTVCSGTTSRTAGRIRNSSRRTGSRLLGSWSHALLVAQRPVYSLLPSLEEPEWKRLKVGCLRRAPAHRGREEVGKGGGHPALGGGRARPEFFNW